ncbi:MAG: hypothetical protein JNM68_10270, partial [Dinghuibacter sp.]|nr:hypothetical protein [Dinghuibacter sp.]
FCTTAIIGSLATATVSAGFGAPVCNNAALGNDVWYKVAVPATGNVIIQTSAVNTTVNNLLLEAYSGSCGSLSFISCDDDGNPEPVPSANHARIVLTGRTPGEQVYFRVMPATTGNRGDFVICAWDTTSTVLPPVSAGGSCVNTVYPVINTTSLNRYMWVPVFDSIGHIVAEIYAGGITLDTVKTSLYIHSGAVRNDNNEFILDRNMTINPTATGTISATIRWYYKNSELTTLRAADSTVSGPANLHILKTSDLCTGAVPTSPNAITPTTGIYGNDHFLQFVTSSFSTFYAEGKCGPTITWTGAADTQWHNPANWGCGGVPWKYSSVVIPSGSPRYPVVMGSTEVKSITIQPGATVTVLTGVDLKVNGQ